MLLRHIYAGQKYTDIYTLSISTEKNQSTKVRDVIHFNRKLHVQSYHGDVTLYYKHITSPGGTKV